MKIFNQENEKKKKWGLGLQQVGTDEARLIAVDSATGDSITTLIFFTIEGDIAPVEGAFQILNAKGYDPCEHRNMFLSDGSIIIKGAC